jgi:hypothetical protein
VLSRAANSLDEFGDERAEAIDEQLVHTVPTKYEQETERVQIDGDLCGIRT